MKISKYLVLFLFVLAYQCYGQMEYQGQVTINSDPRIDNLVKLHTAYNEAFPVISGYRIQIFMKSGNEALNMAEVVKATFIRKYENVNAYLIFVAPYYRVRVGDFRTRLEAEKFLLQISRKYPNAWVIKDEINFPELSNNQKSYKHE